MKALLTRLNLTEGERGVLLAYVVVSVFGAGLALTVVSQLGGENTILRALGIYDMWVIIAGAMGSAMGLFISQRWLGHPGIAGWRKAIIGIPVVSFICAICGGTLALPFYGTMFGPFSVLVTFIGSPILGVFWTAILLSAHALMLEWRQERDSIFIYINEKGVPA